MGILDMKTAPKEKKMNNAPLRNANNQAFRDNMDRIFKPEIKTDLTIEELARKRKEWEQLWKLASCRKKKENETT